jgi:anaerobic selenocysteine-containing dehydrogenase
LAAADADRLGIGEGDLVRIESRRGVIEVAARIGGIREGTVFVPFHFGYFDTAGGGHPDGRPRAANELTIVEWDPVSKQPNFKVAAVRVSRIAAGNGPAPAPTTTASAPVRPGVPPTEGHGRADATSRLESV